MEQKQLDEVEESFEGEEFIDEIDLLNTNEQTDEEVKIEPVSKPKRRRKAAKKGTAAKEIEWPDEDKEETKEEVKEEAKEDDPLVQEMSLKPETELNLEDNEKKEVAKDEPLKTDKSSESTPPVSPWGEDKNDEGSMFKEVSTWKAITGIAIILLVFSVFSDGFNFTGAAVEDTISLAEAENKMVEYVNANFLREPFLAEVSASEEIGSLYKVSLLVAGENVDSYLTKDGKLFFPQGFDTSLTLQEQLMVDQPPVGVELEEVQEIVEEVTIKPHEGKIVVEEVPVENSPEEVEGAEDSPVEVIVEAPTETAPRPPPSEEVVAPTTKEFSLAAKKWLFSPHKLTVNKGDTIVLTINPEDLDITFTMPAYGLTKYITGPTTLEFIANLIGEFDYFCSSCEGKEEIMRGTLVVE